MPTERRRPAHRDGGERTLLLGAKVHGRLETCTVVAHDVREVEASGGCPRGSHGSATALREEVERARSFAHALLRDTGIARGGLERGVAE